MQNQIHNLEQSTKKQKNERNCDSNFKLHTAADVCKYNKTA